MTRSCPEIKVVVCRCVCNPVSCSPGEESHHHPQAWQSHLQEYISNLRNTSMTDVFMHSLIIFTPWYPPCSLLNIYRKWFTNHQEQPYLKCGGSSAAATFFFIQQHNNYKASHRVWGNNNNLVWRMCGTVLDSRLTSTVGLYAQEEAGGETRIQLHLHSPFAVKSRNKWQCGSHPFTSW